MAFHVDSQLWMGTGGAVADGRCSMCVNVVPNIHVHLGKYFSNHSFSAYGSSSSTDCVGSACCCWQLCKRIVVIVTASLYFGSHMPLQAALGIAISTAGTLWYAQALSPKQGTESKAVRDKSPSLHGRALSFEMTSFTKYFEKSPEENDTLEYFDEEEATPTSSLRAASLAHNRSAKFNLGD